jgi:hypothetical protein
LKGERERQRDKDRWRPREIPGYSPKDILIMAWQRKIRKEGRIEQK